MVLYLSTGYRLLGIVYLDQLQCARHTHTSCDNIFWMLKNLSLNYIQIGEKNKADRSSKTTRSGNEWMKTKTGNTFSIKKGTPSNFEPVTIYNKENFKCNQTTFHMGIR